MNMKTWDAAVIGGGPAGCSTAISLAQRGLSVILFEAAKYPHDKMCGEFISPECTSLLAPLGVLEGLTEKGPVTINHSLLTAPDGTVWESILPGTALGLSRSVFDAVLAERAQQVGVELREGARVTCVIGTLEEGFELEVRCADRASTVYARTVIGAYGKRAALDRILNRRFLDQRQPYVALKAHFNGPRIPGRIELHAFRDGYCGLSEIEGDGRVVCLLVRENTFQEMRGQGPNSLDGFIEWMKEQNLYLSSWLQGAERIYERWITISQVPFLPKRVMERDVLMTGDAAGLIVPLAGNGISMALEGGLLASDYLSGYFSGLLDPAGLRRLYPAAWEKKFGARIRLGRVLQPLMFKPARLSMALRLVNLFPGLGRLLIKHTRGEPTPHSNFWLGEQSTHRGQADDLFEKNGEDHREERSYIPK